MNEKSERYASLDLIRSIAILLVVGVHVVNRFYTFSLKGMSSISTASFIFCCTWRAIGSAGVALFFMLTGYLLLSRRYETTKDITDFWKKKFLPLLICYEVWVLIEEPLQIYKNGFEIQDLIKRILMLEENQLIRPMWYMHSIIGIYLFLPFLSIIMHKMTPKLMILPLSVCFFYLFCIPTANIVLNVLGYGAFSAKIDIAFIGGYKGLYVIFGYLIKEYAEPALKASEKKKTRCALLAVTAVLALIVHTISIGLCFRFDYVYSMQYDIAFVPFYTAPLFILVLMLPKIRFAKLWNEISVMSFGIFFIHYPLLLIAL